jgi:hypothetical protein
MGALIVMGSLCCGYCEIVRDLGRAVVVYTSEKVGEVRMWGGFER